MPITTINATHGLRTNANKERAVRLMLMRIQILALCGVVAAGATAWAQCSDQSEADSSCDTSTWNGTPCPPQAPAQYTLPAGAVVVRTSADLTDALKSTTAKDIILEDGTYTSGSNWYPYAGHRLWARHVGKAILTAGLEINEPNFEVHGLKFAITSYGPLAGDGSAIHSAYGNYGRKGDGLKVTDTTIDGGNVALHGVYAQAVHGVVIERVVLTKFRYEGIMLRSYGTTVIAPNPPPIIRDVDVSYVKDTAGINNGTQEFGILVGNSAPGALIERVNCHHVDWSCIITAGPDVAGLTVSDVMIDYTNDRGFYIEHFTRDLTVKRFVIGAHVVSGVNAEGAMANWNWKPAGGNYKFFDGTVDTSRNGMSFESCNGPIDVRRVRFLHQCQFALIEDTDIAYNAGRCSPAGPVTQSSNDFSRLGSTAQPVGVNVPSWGNICGGYKPW
jgi:hypothetical protein